ncbi:hypothetical protein ACWDR0_19025 [Streptomyces sp. NPDC003691]
MHHDHIDGVPVLWTGDRQGPLEAVLVFGAGALDDPRATRGAIRLVAHLAASTLPRTHHLTLDWWSLENTCFGASGTPEQVVNHLDAVCRGLSRLPLDRLAHEAEVLATSNTDPVGEMAGILLWGRYGHSGAGSANHEGPGIHGVPAGAVRAAADRFFHRENAVLVLSGPPPEGLRLPLPEGRRPASRRAMEPEAVTGAAWFSAEEVSDPGMSWRTDPGDPAAVLAHALFRDRLVRALRHRNALSYDVRDCALLVGPGTAESFFLPDAREGYEQQVAELMWQEALRLAAEDPTEAELAQEVAGYRGRWESPDHTMDELVEAATCLLLDREYRDPGTRLADLAAVTPDRVRTACAAALRTALMVVPEGLVPHLPRPDGGPVPPLGCWVYGTPAPGTVFRPKAYERLRHREVRRARMVVTDDGLWHVRDPDDVHYVTFADAAGLLEWENGVLLLGRGHCSIDVNEHAYADGHRLVAAIRAAVPEHLHFRGPGWREDPPD